MDGKFTPGRWIATRCGTLAPDRWNIHAEQGFTENGIRKIRTIDQVLDYCGAEEAAANARLIAAAPDQHNALKAFAGWNFAGSAWEHAADHEAVLYDHKSGRAITVGDFRRATAAIARATGDA